MILPTLKITEAMLDIGPQNILSEEGEGDTLLKRLQGCLPARKDSTAPASHLL